MNIKQPQSTFSALALAVVVGLSGPALANRRQVLAQVLQHPLPHPRRRCHR